jgi:hypothetical protein
MHIGRSLNTALTLVLALVLLAVAATPLHAQSAATTNYELRLRELEDRMNELKEDIFRTKSRLFLLRQTILQTEVGGSRAVISHISQLSSSYRVMRVIYSLDGNAVYAETRETADLGRTFQVFDGPVLAGSHNLAVEAVLQGNEFGVFSYMEGYEIVVRSSHQFDVAEGQTVELDVRLRETGGPNRPLEERPTIEFRLRTQDTTMDHVSTSAE